MADVGGRCTALVVGVAPIADLVDYVEVPWNESHQNGPDLTAYSRGTVQAVRLLKATGHKVLVGNFSVGNPAALADWVRFWPALREADGLSLHEYSSPTMQTDRDFKCLRYREVYKALPADCRKPLFITESGIDWGDPTAAQNGYQSHQATAPADYAAQLSWYLTEVGKDSYVRGVVIYACGVFSDFASFDVAGVSGIEAVVRQFSGGIVPTPTFNVGAGVLALMAKHQDTPQSDEHYVLDATGQTFKSETFGTKGIYQWSKQANVTVMTPFG